MKSLLLKTYSSVSSRSKIVLKNVALSGLVKATNIIISFFTVPLTLKYLNQEEYGLWLTIYSIMTWLMYFDGGLGSGLRNKFTEAKAKNESYKIRSYISTSYFILFCTIGILIPLFFILNIWFDWGTFLKITGENNKNFNNTIFLIFTIFCLQFVFRLIDSILIADQKSGESDLLNLIGSAFSLLIFYIITPFFNKSFILVSIVFCGIPLLVNIIYTIYLFLTRYNKYIPSHKFVELNDYKELMTLGSKFFIIQICSLITIGSTNIIITKVLSASDVVIYNLAFKYFSIALLAFGVLAGSMFSSFNEAYQRGEIIWIKNMVKKVRLVSFFFICIIAIMLFFANFVYSFWVGTTIRIPLNLNILMGLYYSLIIFCTVYTTFIAAIGKIRVTYYVSIINSILYIPMALFLTKFMGINGLIISQLILFFPGLFWLPMQYNKLINNKANGLWNK